MRLSGGTARSEYPGREAGAWIEKVRSKTADNPGEGPTTDPLRALWSSLSAGGRAGYTAAPDRPAAAQSDASSTQSRRALTTGIAAVRATLGPGLRLAGGRSSRRKLVRAPIDLVQREVDPQRGQRHAVPRGAVGEDPLGADAPTVVDHAPLPLGD